MPKTTKKGQAKQSELPDTLERSYGCAKKLDVSGRSRMSKPELAKAIARRQG